MQIIDAESGGTDPDTMAGGEANGSSFRAVPHIQTTLIRAQCISSVPEGMGHLIGDILCVSTNKAVKNLLPSTPTGGADRPPQSKSICH